METHNIQKLETRLKGDFQNVKASKKILNFISTK